MRIALAQVLSSIDPDANLDLVRDYAQRAKDADADLVVFPEATMASFATRSADVAQPLDGPWADGVRHLAREVGIAVVVGMFTPAAGGKARNTLLAMDAEGAVVASYDKIHLFDAWGFQESRHMEAGDRPVLVTIGGVRFGLATCYDVRFPELFKHLAHAGAEVILVPTSWANGPGKPEQFRALCVTRALDTTCFIVAPAQSDPASAGQKVRPGSPTGVGHSIVVGPLGEVIAEAEEASELLVVDLDPADVAGARERLPVLTNSRFTISAPAAG